MAVASAGPYALCKQFAPHSREITRRTPYQSVLTGLDALLDVQPTVSNH